MITLLLSCFYCYCSEQTDPGVALVFLAFFRHPGGRSVAIRFYFYRNVLYVHGVLVLQILLCVRLHAVSIWDFSDGDYLHDSGRRIFRTECGESPLAMDCVLLRWIRLRLRVLIFYILFLLQDSNDRPATNMLLLWLHVSSFQTIFPLTISSLSSSSSSSSSSHFLSSNHFLLFLFLQVPLLLYTSTCLRHHRRLRSDSVCQQDL